MAFDWTAAVHLDGNSLARFEIVLGADSAYPEDDGLQPSDSLGRGFVLGQIRHLRIGLQHDGLVHSALQRCDLAPEFIGDERHQRVHHPQGAFEHFDQRVARGGFHFIGGLVIVQRDFRELDIPVAILVPHELVDGLRGEVEAIGFKTRLDIGECVAKTLADPPLRDAEARGLRRARQFGVTQDHQDKTRCVPDLVAEIAIPVDPPQIEAHIPTLRRHGRKCEAQGIGAITRHSRGKLAPRGGFDFGRVLGAHESGRALADERLQVDAVDQIDRVEDVAFRFRHFLAFRVAHQTMDVDLAERHLAHELQAHHDHACNPEEDDVESRDQHGRGVKSAEFRRFCRPAKGRKRP